MDFPPNDAAKLGQYLALHHEMRASFQRFDSPQMKYLGPHEPYHLAYKPKQYVCLLFVLGFSSVVVLAKPFLISQSLQLSRRIPEQLTFTRPTRWHRRTQTLLQTGLEVIDGVQCSLTVQTTAPGLTAVI